MNSTDDRMRSIYKSLLDGWKWVGRPINPCSDCTIEKCRSTTKSIKSCEHTSDMRWVPFELGDKFYDNWEYKKIEYKVMYNQKQDKFSIEIEGDSKLDGNSHWVCRANNMRTKEDCEEWISNHTYTWLEKVELEYGDRGLDVARGTLSRLQEFAEMSQKKYGNIVVYFMEEASQFIKGSKCFNLYS